MKKLYAALPGPVPVKIILALVIVVVALVALIAVFELLGTFLDDGGVIG